MVATLENQARLAYAQSMGQNRTNPTEAEQCLTDRSENAVASLKRVHSEQINKVAADCKRQFASTGDDAREKGRQHDLQVAEYKRKVELANNTVGDELAESMLQMQVERVTELQSIERTSKCDHA